MVSFYENVMALIQKEKNFELSTPKEKLLTFYFTFFEVLQNNRSYILFSLNYHKKITSKMSQLSFLKNKFTVFASDLVNDGNLNKPVYLKHSPKLFSEAAWVQLLFLINFWVDDTSPEFEKTDLAIEKSVRTAFDVFDNTPWSQLLISENFYGKKNINNLNTLNHIPVNKVKRATSLVSAGVKLSGNYLRYYGEKVLKVEGSRGRLDKKNARDIYDSLKTLKGSALKVAQMLSMENNLLPSAYVEQFSLSQFSVPPLSWPLVNKLVKKYLGKSAHLIFDTFDVNSKNAASIGQVHQASLNGKELAVKIQYPGVRESIYSDLSIIKPFATRMFNLRGKDIENILRKLRINYLRKQIMLLN